MAEYRYYLIPDAMTRAFPEQFGKQTPTEFFDNIADLEKRYHQLREMPYNNERTWNERTRFPYARLVVGIDRQNPDGAVAIIQVRNGVNYLCDDYRGPYADRNGAKREETEPSEKTGKENGAAHSLSGTGPRQTSRSRNKGRCEWGRTFR